MIQPNSSHLPVSLLICCRCCGERGHREEYQWVWIVWRICSGRKRKTPVEAFVGGAGDAGVAGGIAGGVGKVMWDYSLLLRARMWNLCWWRSYWGWRGATQANAECLHCSGDDWCECSGGQRWKVAWIKVYGREVASPGHRERSSSFAEEVAGVNTKNWLREGWKGCPSEFLLPGFSVVCVQMHTKKRWREKKGREAA